MERPLICCSLRGRPDWVSLVPALLQNNNGAAAWRESSQPIQSHDVALPLPLPGGGQRSSAVFRAILLTPSEVGTDGTRSRVERLYHLNGGQYVAIVLLLKQCGDEGPTAALMRLQLDGREMPIIPVSSVETTPTTLWAFHRQLSTSIISKRSADPARSLLPYCTATRTVPDHELNMLSDITVNMRDLADKATSLEGQQKITKYLGKHAESIIDFWSEDFMVD